MRSGLCLGVIAAAEHPDSCRQRHAVVKSCDGTGSWVSKCNLLLPFRYHLMVSCCSPQLPQAVVNLAPEKGIQLVLTTGRRHAGGVCLD
jgi:hypothetical protein